MKVHFSAQTELSGVKVQGESMYGVEIHCENVDVETHILFQ